MKRHWHDSIRQVKGLLDTISMVDIYINVDNSWVDKKKFKYCQNNIVYITKTTGLWFFGMMKPSSKINGNICFPIEQ